MWAVLADAPQHSARDILAQIKGDPASVTFGVGSMPSNDYFNVLRPALQYGVDHKKLRIAAFRGNLNIQLLGGHAHVISTTASEALEQVRAGKMRLLATSAPAPQDGELNWWPSAMSSQSYCANWDSQSGAALRGDPSRSARDSAEGRPGL